MGTTQRTRRWAVGVAAIAAMLALAACGRVDLEDLTPEAVRTQQASIPTAQPGGGNGTPGSDGASGADLVAGKTQYNTWCAGCHDGGRAQPIKGKVLEFSAIESIMRTGQGASAPHPSYKVTELTDNQFSDILSYLASEPAP